MPNDYTPAAEIADVLPPFPNREHHTTPCPGCGHALGIHAREIGCVEGWKHDDQGRATANGCACSLTLCGDARPATERDL